VNRRAERQFGYSIRSSQGREAIARMEQVHARFSITDEQRLYTLATLIFAAERIGRHLGFDPLGANQREASHTDEGRRVVDRFFEDWATRWFRWLLRASARAYMPLTLVRPLPTNRSWTDSFARGATGWPG
jgi:PAS domain-containing protein